MDRVAARCPALALACAALAATLLAAGRSLPEFVLAGLVCIVVPIIFRHNTGALKVFLGASVFVYLWTLYLALVPVSDYSIHQYTGTVEEITVGERAQTGLVDVDGIGRVGIVVIDIVPDIVPGDRIEFTAALQPANRYDAFPWMRMSAIAARARRVSASVVLPPGDITVVGHDDGIVYRFDSVRRRIAEAVYASPLSPDASALLVASFLGTGDSPPAIKDSFRATGLSHLLCVSGFHVGLVAGILALILAPLRLWRGRPGRRLLAGVTLVWLYAMAVGFSPSVVRASVMITAYTLARILQRTPMPVNNLCLAFFMVLAVDPYWLFSAGFQLSFAAVAGLLLLVPKLNPFGHDRRNLRTLANLVLVPLVAMLATAPVVLTWFHSLPLFSVVANSVGVLIFPVFMIAGGLSVVLYALGVPSGVSLEIAELCHRAVTALADRLADFGLDFSFMPGTLTVVALSVGLISLCVLLYIKRGRHFAVAAICVSLLCTGCEGTHDHGVLVIDGDSRGINIAVVNPGAAEIYSNRRDAATGAVFGRLLLDYGVEDANLSINSLKRHIVAENRLVAVAARDYEPDEALQPDVLIVSASYRGEPSSLWQTELPTYVVLASDMTYERRQTLSSYFTGLGARVTDLHTAAFMAEL